MTAPVFLMCSERSGSNLLRAIMDSHPGICAPPPPHLISFFVPLLRYYGSLDSADRRVQLAEDVLAVMQRQLGEWKSSPDAAALVERARTPGFFPLVQAAYALEAEAQGKSRVVIKDNGVLRFAPLILSAVPSARFLYLVRDPRDVALSWLKSPSHYGGVGAAARVWKQEQQAGLDFLAATQQRSCVHLVAYESLLDAPEQVLRGVCEFIGEPYSSEMLRFHAKQRERPEHQRLDNWRNLSRPLMKGNHGKWRTELSVRRVRQVERLACSEMRSAGYRPQYVLEPSKSLWSWRLFRRGMKQVRTVAKLVLGGSASRDELSRRARRVSALASIESRIKASPSAWEMSSGDQAPGHATAGENTFSKAATS